MIDTAQEEGAPSTMIETYFCSISGLPLNDYIRHFEPAFYTPLLSNQEPITNNPRLAKRSINSYQKDDVEEFNAVTTPPTPTPAPVLSFNVTAHNR